jgi:hypothetical protein
MIDPDIYDSLASITYLNLNIDINQMPNKLNLYNHCYEQVVLYKENRGHFALVKVLQKISLFILNRDYPSYNQNDIIFCSAPVWHDYKQFINLYNTYLNKLIYTFQLWSLNHLPLCRDVTQYIKQLI